MKDKKLFNYTGIWRKDRIALYKLANSPFAETLAPFLLRMPGPVAAALLTNLPSVYRSALLEAEPTIGKHVADSVNAGVCAFIRPDGKALIGAREDILFKEV